SVAGAGSAGMQLMHRKARAAAGIQGFMGAPFRSAALSARAGGSFNGAGFRAALTLGGHGRQQVSGHTARGEHYATGATP
ncbi:MAG: hypothetical protein C0461_10760, partial [Brevundimonas sp.]|nr:hypothetical protein [Brevundimonas sp.]